MLPSEDPRVTAATLSVPHCQCRVQWIRGCQRVRPVPGNLTCGCTRRQVVALPRGELRPPGRSLAGAGSISRADVRALILVAVPAIADAFAEHADPACLPTRGGVLSALFQQWRFEFPNAAVSEFTITKSRAAAVLQARPAWRGALGGGTECGDDFIASRLCKLARAVIDPRKSRLCGNIPASVRQRGTLQTHATWDGVVAWSQTPDATDFATRARRESGLARLDAYLAERAVECRPMQPVTPAQLVMRLTPVVGPQPQAVPHVYMVMCKDVIRAAAASGVEIHSLVRKRKGKCLRVRVPPVRKGKGKLVRVSVPPVRSKDGGLLARVRVPVPIPAFAISGRKTIVIDSVTYYIEMITEDRLLCLQITHGIRVKGVEYNIFEQDRVLADAVVATNGAIAEVSEFRAAMVGPSNGRGDNEVMLIGTAHGVMNANALPSGVLLPPWASKHLSEVPAHNMLLMLRDVDYIGGGQTIPMARLNGQTTTCNALPPEIIEHIQWMERFHPPTQSQSGTAIWYDDIGPGRGCSVYFNEDEP